MCTLAEHEFFCALVRIEVKTERKIYPNERIFKDFGEIFALTSVVCKIVCRLVVQTGRQTAECDVEVDVVAQRHEHAQLKFGQIESVVESDAYTAVEVGACKFDFNAVDVEQIEHLFEEVGREHDFKSVIAEIETVEDARNESEHGVDIHAVARRVVCGESLSASRAACANAERCKKLFCVNFDFFDVYAKDVRFEINPTVLQIERKHFFVVGLLGYCNLRGRFEEHIEDCVRVNSAGEVDIRVDVEFKTAVDVSEFDQCGEQNALEHRSDVLIGHVDGDLCKFAFECIDVNGESRRNVYVEQIGVKFAVFEDGQICVGICFEFFFEFFERCVKSGQIVNFTKGNSDAESKSDERFRIFYAEICGQRKSLLLLCAEILINQRRILNRNFRTCVLALEHHTENGVEQIFGELNFDASDIEDVAVHIEIDMVEYHIDQCQNIHAAVGIRRRKRAVLNDDFAVIYKGLLNILSGCSALESVECSLDCGKRLVYKLAEQVIDVDVVDFKLRSVRAEQTACVKIYAFSCARVVCRDAFCTVSAENFKSESCLFGISGVDFALELDRQLNRTFFEVNFLCKERFESFEHLGFEIFGEKI
ncbi:unknown [Firmicutes bacterium CAG:475]|nr:unknown [Firmicutes bacterium CAG:475]